MSLKKTFLPLLTILLIFLTLAFLLDLALGSVNIPIDQIITILAGQQPEKLTWTNIILKFRLPKAITATLAGAALGVSGLQMQTLFRNPLAGPYILGISSGASLGVAILVLTATPILQNFPILNDLSLIIAACIGAAAVLGLVLTVSQHVSDTMTLLILGLLFGYATNALVSILLQFSE
ncbi:MAG: iron ABC transporter permease, partial [Calothrix sp. SM1_7_51]|nr:iron ABC transporter permease [Calothrix sp. SM1_7_51]